MLTSKDKFKTTKKEQAPEKKADHGSVEPRHESIPRLDLQHDSVTIEQPEMIAKAMNKTHGGFGPHANKLSSTWLHSSQKFSPKNENMK